LSGPFVPFLAGMSAAPMLSAKRPDYTQVVDNFRALNML